MTPEILLVFVLLAFAVLLLVTAWIPMEATALFVLGTSAAIGLVTPAEALSGFSNPAVVTVWAVFILSGGLTRTGVTAFIGRRVLRMSGRSEMRTVAVIMLSAGVLSAFINNIAVTAFMMPVIMDMSRQANHPPSRLLIPLSFGSLLGGSMTLIGRPPNILAGEALHQNGLAPFGFFDFAPVGGLVFLAGIAFMILFGRQLLPRRNVKHDERPQGATSLEEQYELRERMFLLHIPHDSALAGKTLAESRLGSALGLNVISIIRNGSTRPVPPPNTLLLPDDNLLVQGRMERLKELIRWGELSVDGDPIDLGTLLSSNFTIAEVTISIDSDFLAQRLNGLDCRNRFGLNVLAVRRKGKPVWTELQDSVLEPDDRLLVLGPADRAEELAETAGSGEYRPATLFELTDVYRLTERVMWISLSPGSFLSGKTLEESRLGDALGLRVLAIKSRDGSLSMAGPEEILRAGDRLLVEGQKEDIDVLRGLEELEIAPASFKRKSLESRGIGLMEAVLSPHGTLAGKTLRQLNFRERHGLNVLAVWREGVPHRSSIGDLPLRLGDALLLFGPRNKLHLLGKDPEFLVLTEAAQEPPNYDKAHISTLIMAGTLLPVLLGFLPIYIAVVIGASAMIVTRCLTMEEAYRFIEWKAVFLIAGLLPLGVSLEKTGAAGVLAEGLIDLFAPFGPRMVLAGLVFLALFASALIPAPAVVVLMSPVVFKTSGDMGLSPHALMMAVAVASISFSTPFTHPSNVLVMGAGGYRFSDYLKVGIPLTLLIFTIILLAVPLFWPLS